MNTLEMLMNIAFFIVNYYCLAYIQTERERDRGLYDGESSDNIVYDIFRYRLSDNETSPEKSTCHI